MTVFICYAGHSESYNKYFTFPPYILFPKLFSNNETARNSFDGTLRTAEAHQVKLENFSLDELFEKVSDSIKWNPLKKFLIQSSETLLKKFLIQSSETLLKKFLIQSSETLWKSFWFNQVKLFWKSFWFNQVKLFWKSFWFNQVMPWQGNAELPLRRLGKPPAPRTPPTRSAVPRSRNYQIVSPFGWVRHRSKKVGGGGAKTELGVKKGGGIVRWKALKFTVLIFKHLHAVMH